MMFLILQLAFWLLVAGLLGFGAGWFLQARRMGTKLTEQRERSRQHIQRLELGLAESQNDEPEPYAKEQRNPIEISENPASFLSGGEYEKLAESEPSAQSESSGLSKTQTVTLTPITATAEVVEPQPAGPEVEQQADVATPLVSSPAPKAAINEALDKRLLNCERDILSLRHELGVLEKRCSADARMAEPANQPAAKPAETAGSIQSWALAAPNGEPDDLKRIWGVGPKLEDMLHDMGIFHFHQIAAFSPADVESVSAQLDQFADRVKRDDWITQAKKLMAEQR